MSDEAIRMTCKEFEEILNDLDRAGMPEGALREQALAHAESCSPCARLLTETESLGSALQAISAEDSDRRAPAHVEAALLQAFRQEKQASPHRRIWWQMAALATAAVVLLALGFSLRDHLWTGTNSPVANVTSTSPSGQPVQTGVGSPSVLSADAVAPEFGTGFVALPYADDAGSMEGAAVGSRGAFAVCACHAGSSRCGRNRYERGSGGPDRKRGRHASGYPPGVRGDHELGRQENVRGEEHDENYEEIHRMGSSGVGDFIRRGKCGRPIRARAGSTCYAACGTGNALRRHWIRRLRGRVWRQDDHECAIHGRVFDANFSGAQRWQPDSAHNERFDRARQRGPYAT